MSKMLRRNGPYPFAVPVPVCRTEAALRGLPVSEDFFVVLELFGSTFDHIWYEQLVSTEKPLLSVGGYMIPVKWLNMPDLAEQIETVKQHWTEVLSTATIATKRLEDQPALLLTLFSKLLGLVGTMGDNTPQVQKPLELLQQDGVRLIQKHLQEQIDTLKVCLEVMNFHYTMLVCTLQGEASAHNRLRQYGQSNGRNSGRERRDAKPRKHATWLSMAERLRTKNPRMSCRAVAQYIAKAYKRVLDSEDSHECVGVPILSADKGSLETIRKAIADLFPRHPR